MTYTALLVYSKFGGGSAAETISLDGLPVVGSLITVVKGIPTMMMGAVYEVLQCDRSKDGVLDFILRVTEKEREVKTTCSCSCSSR